MRNTRIFTGTAAEVGEAGTAMAVREAPEALVRTLLSRLAGQWIEDRQLGLPVLFFCARREAEIGLNRGEIASKTCF